MGTLAKLFCYLFSGNKWNAEVSFIVFAGEELPWPPWEAQFMQLEG